jgi:hypothetical protein
MPNEYFVHDIKLQPGTKARAEDVNKRFDDIVTGLNKLPAPHPTQTGFIVPIVVGDATEPGHAISAAKALGGGLSYAQDTGIANAYVANLGIAPASYTDGLTVTFKAVNANTEAATLNVNGLGIKQLCRSNGDQLIAGDIAAGQIVTAIYNGTKFLGTAAFQGQFDELAAECQGYAASADADAATATSQATIATTKAAEAALSATNAANAANTATTKADIATSKATEATNSALTAANAEDAAETAAATATSQATIATTKAGEASGFASNAANSAAAASTSETEAENSATTASNAASTATTQATIATTQAGIATTKADIATAKAIDAENAAAVAEAIMEQFPVITAADVSKILVVQPDFTMAYAFPRTAKKNYLINGGPTVWQHGTSLSVPGYDGGADRWFNAPGGSSLSHAALGIAVDDPAGATNTRMHVFLTSVAGASNYALFGQRVEGVKTLNGKKATLSFKASANLAGKKVGVELRQSFGSGGSAAIALPPQAVNITTTHTRYSVTLDIPSIPTGKIYGPGDHLLVNFWLDAGANWASMSGGIGQQGSTQFFFSEFQLEEGPAATDFERRPYGEELIDCMRYSEQIHGVVQTALTYRNYALKAQKRAVPVINRLVFTSGGTGAAFTAYDSNNIHQTAAHSVYSHFSAFVVAEL